MNLLRVLPGYGYRSGARSFVRMRRDWPLGLSYSKTSGCRIVDWSMSATEWLPIHGFSESEQRP